MVSDAVRFVVLGLRQLGSVPLAEAVRQATCAFRAGPCFPQVATFVHLLAARLGALALAAAARWWQARHRSTAA